MKIAIVGSRECGDFSVENIIDHIPNNCTLIISGGAIGIDSLGELAAKELGIPTKIFYPDYNKYGKMAPLIRNRDIADSCDLLLAFWDLQSNGTGHILEYAVKNHINFKIIPLKKTTTISELLKNNKPNPPNQQSLF